jgi:hypothetical protein
VQFAGGSPNVAVRYLPLMLSGIARQWINDLAENSIQTWFDMQTAFTENFEGTYKRPHNIGDVRGMTPGRVNKLERYKDYG